MGNEEKEELNPTTTENNEDNNKGGNPTFDYDKIQKMLDGTLKAKEDSALKAYFKQQGVSQEDVETLITDFKTKQKDSKPDVNALNEKITKTEASLRTEIIKSETLQMTQELGVDMSSVKYLLKLADTSNVFSEDGTLKKDDLKKSLEKVLEEVPALKKAEQNGAGFKQIGGSNTPNPQKTADNELRKRFGLKPIQ